MPGKPIRALRSDAASGSESQSEKKALSSSHKIASENFKQAKHDAGAVIQSERKRTAAAGISDKRGDAGGKLHAPGKREIATIEQESKESLFSEQVQESSLLHEQEERKSSKKQRSVRSDV